MRREVLDICSKIVIRVLDASESINQSSINRSINQSTLIKKNNMSSGLLVPQIATAQ